MHIQALDFAPGRAIIWPTPRHCVSPLPAASEGGLVFIRSHTHRRCHSWTGALVEVLCGLLDRLRQDRVLFCSKKRISGTELAQKDPNQSVFATHSCAQLFHLVSLCHPDPFRLDVVTENGFSPLQKRGVDSDLRGGSGWQWTPMPQALPSRRHCLRLASMITARYWHRVVSVCVPRAATGARELHLVRVHEFEVGMRWRRGS